MRKNLGDATGQKFPFGADARMTSGCSKRLSSKAAASEEARRTFRYVESLSDARTPLADFFSILLDESA
jgi:hypothetical protein